MVQDLGHSARVLWLSHSSLCAIITAAAMIGMRGLPSLSPKSLNPVIHCD